MYIIMSIKKLVSIVCHVSYTGLKTVADISTVLHVTMAAGIELNIFSSYYRTTEIFITF